MDTPLEAYCKGWRAWKDGNGIQSNPYPSKSILGLRWIVAWKDGEATILNHKAS